MDTFRTELLEVKFDESKPGYFEGYGSIFNNVDNGNDIVVPGAFSESLNEMQKKGRMPSMFYMHNPRESIGEWLSMVEDTKGLKVSGQLWVGSNIPRAEQAYKMVRSRGQNGLSIGYKKKKWANDTKGRRLLEKVDLKEISVVAFPMNDEALVTAVKTAEGKYIGKAELEEILRDVGLSQREAKSLISGGYSALTRDADDAVFTDDVMQGLLNHIQNIQL